MMWDVSEENDHTQKSGNKNPKKKLEKIVVLKIGKISHMC